MRQEHRHHLWPVLRQAQALPVLRQCRKYLPYHRRRKPRELLMMSQSRPRIPHQIPMRPRSNPIRFRLRPRRRQGYPQPVDARRQPVVLLE
jgi:hypothetical protein